MWVLHISHSLLFSVPPVQAQYIQLPWFQEPRFAMLFNTRYTFTIEKPRRQHINFKNKQWALRGTSVIAGRSIHYAYMPLKNNYLMR